MKSLADHYADINALRTDKLSPYEERIAEQEKAVQDDAKQNVNMALMQAGLNIASSTSPTVLGAIAQGGIPALQGYQQNQVEQRKEMRDMLGIRSNLATARQHGDDSALSAASQANQAAQNLAQQQAQQAQQDRQFNVTAAENARHNQASEANSAASTGATTGYYDYLKAQSADKTTDPATMAARLNTQLAASAKLLGPYMGQDPSTFPPDMAAELVRYRSLRAQLDAANAAMAGSSAPTASSPVPSLTQEQKAARAKAWPQQ